MPSRDQNNHDQIWQRIRKRERRLPKVYQQFGVEVRAAHDALIKDKDYERVWFHLERAHVLSQSSTSRHFGIHFVMFCFAIMRRDFREILGQIARMLLAVPSSLLGKAPIGNTGRSNVSMFAALPLSKDLEKIIVKR